MLHLKSLHLTYKTLDVSRPVLIFGAGNFAKDLSNILKNKGFNVLGFVTSDTWNNYTPQVKVQLLIGIYNRESPFNRLYEEVLDHGYTDIFSPIDIYNNFSTELGWRYWLGTPDQILDNLDNISRVYNMLSDDISRKCLNELCMFRLGLNLDYSSVRHSEVQYFNDLTLNKLIVSFVDGGAYNGDSFNQLKSVMPSVSQAFLFEPSSANYQLMVNNVKDAVCLPLAISDKLSQLRFNSNNGEGSTFSDAGDTVVTAVSIDDMFSCQIDFIKLDLEGAEALAINGAKNVIKSSRPTMAISLYHKPCDIWEIPLQLLNYCIDYKFYIRQHYNNSFDCVLYAVPI